MENVQDIFEQFDDGRNFVENEFAEFKNDVGKYRDTIVARIKPSKLQRDLLKEAKEFGKPFYVMHHFDNGSTYCLNMGHGSKIILLILDPWNKWSVKNQWKKVIETVQDIQSSSAFYLRYLDYRYAFVMT